MRFPSRLVALPAAHAAAAVLAACGGAELGGAGGSKPEGAELLAAGTPVFVSINGNVDSGQWQAAALLVKVDKSPVTREWTADPNSGTSNNNEAIWVMTSDQVEVSTGWTCTARIASRDDAVRFLHNYPNGSLRDVLDTEVRGKLQSTFGLEVTDEPMTKLREEATPHSLRTVKDVTEFFKERGVTITNLGITGGFIYKDKSIMDTMVRVFNAEQEKAIATAGYQVDVLA